MLNMLNHGGNKVKQTILSAEMLSMLNMLDIMFKERLLSAAMLNMLNVFWAHGPLPFKGFFGHVELFLQNAVFFLC